MDAANTRFRELGFRISTLTTTRNIRGFQVYAKIGYAELAPFRRAGRRVTSRTPPE